MFDQMEVDRDPASMGDTELSAQLHHLCALADQIETARLAALAEWDHRGLWAQDGAASAAGWLAAQGRLGRAQASGLVRTARFLRTNPATRAAVDAGTLTPAKARLLAAAVTPRIEDTFVLHEDELIAQTEPLSVDQTATLLRFWAMQADTDGNHPDDHHADRAYLSQTLAGRWRLDADLDTEGGAIVDSVLNGIADALYTAAQQDPADIPALSAAQLRAAALVDMARRATAADDDRSAARPLLWIRSDVADMQHQTGTAHIDGAGPITAVAARRLACDAGVARVLTDGPSAIIDLGVTARTATPTQRRLLALRDKGCVFPGCDRPPGWCHAHHIIHWIDHGPTNLDNLCLLCSHHHHRIHEGGFQLSRAPDGTLTITKPDGTPLPTPHEHAYASV